jgi:hypothetical protein
LAFFQLDKGQSGQDYLAYRLFGHKGR